MPALTLRDGKLLLGPSGLGTSLGINPYCCCPDDLGTGDECPPCCIKVNGGVFDPGGNLVFTAVSGGYTLNVTMVMPTKNSRIICDGQQVSLLNDLTTDPGDTLGPYHSPVTVWDRAWIYQAHSPDVEPDGIANEYGMIEWGDTSVATSTQVDLKFTKCYVDHPVQYGDISVRFANPDLLININVTNCPSSFACCVNEVECDRCCSYIPLGAGEVIDNNWVFWAQNAGYSMRVKILNVDPDTRIVCEGGRIDLEIEIVPEPGAPNPYKPELCIDHPGWENIAESPPIPQPNDPLTGVKTPGSTCWGTENEELSYTISLESPVCGDNSELLRPGPINISTKNPAMAIEIPFVQCDDWPCTCCCPKRCCFDCFFPVDQSNPCPPVGVTWITGGDTQIINFVTEANADELLWCDEPGFPTSDVLTVTQVGPSRMQVVCQQECDIADVLWCLRASCNFQIDAVDQCGVTYLLDLSYVRDPDDPDPTQGVWRVQSIYWALGGSTVTSSCTAAHSVGSGNFPPLSPTATINYETSFEVIGPTSGCVDEEPPDPVDPGGP